MSAKTQCFCSKNSHWSTCVHWCSSIVWFRCLLPFQTSSSTPGLTSTFSLFTSVPSLKARQAVTSSSPLPSADVRHVSGRLPLEAGCIRHARATHARVTSAWARSPSLEPEADDNVRPLSSRLANVQSTRPVHDSASISLRLPLSSISQPRLQGWLLR